MLSARHFAVLQKYPRMSAVLLPFAAGGVMVLAMPPWAVWPMLHAGFAAFYLLLNRTPKSWGAFFCGWLFGFGYFLFGLSWIANALLVDGNEFSWVWPLAIMGLPALLAIFTGAGAALARRCFNLTTLPGFLSFCGIISLAEWLRGHVATGFPWNLYGYAWAGVPEVAQSVALFGIYGLTLLSILWGALPGFLLLWHGKAWEKAVLAVTLYGVLAGLFVSGHIRLAAHPDISFDRNIVLRVIQPSIPQDMKWSPQKAIDNYLKILDASQAKGATLATPATTTILVWPETAVTQNVLENADAASDLRDMLDAYPGGVFLAAGVLRYSKGDNDQLQFYNSIGLYGRGGNMMATYDKSHLVPFGEYIPFHKWLRFGPFVSIDGFQAGDGVRTMAIPVAEGKALTISPLICYEVIFPGAVVQRQGMRPSLLLNVTNDGWYGDSAGPRQHLAIARFRAIEEGLPLARSANTGISAIVDPYGRTVWQASLFETAASNVYLPHALSAPTFYAIHRDIVYFCTALLLVATGLFLRRKPFDSSAN